MIVTDFTPADPRIAKLDNVLATLRMEVIRAMTRYPPFYSPHVGYAVILEEVDDLWDEVKANRGRQSGAINEAMQTAAMGVRYVLDFGP